MKKSLDLRASFLGGFLDSPMKLLDAAENENPAERYPKLFKTPASVLMKYVLEDKRHCCCGGAGVACRSDRDTDVQRWA